MWPPFKTTLKRNLVILLILLATLFNVAASLPPPPPGTLIPYPVTENCPQGWFLLWYLPDHRYCDSGDGYGDYFLFACNTTDIGYDFNAACTYPSSDADVVSPEFQVNLPLVHGITGVVSIKPPGPLSE